MTTKRDGCHVGICMTADSDGCNMDYLLKEKSYIISHYWKWFPRKLNLIESTLYTLLTLCIYCIRIRKRQGKYSPIEPFAWRSSRGQSPRELMKAKGYIWPYILSRVLCGHYIILTIIKLMFTPLLSLTISPYTP